MRWGLLLSSWSGRRPAKISASRAKHLLSFPPEPKPFGAKLWLRPPTSGGPGDISCHGDVWQGIPLFICEGAEVEITESIMEVEGKDMATQGSEGLGPTEGNVSIIHSYTVVFEL